LAEAERLKTERLEKSVCFDDKINIEDPGLIECESLNWIGWERGWRFRGML
jgi:hypothetical protein